MSVKIRCKWDAGAPVRVRIRMRVMATVTVKAKVKVREASSECRMLVPWPAHH